MLRTLLATTALVLAASPAMADHKGWYGGVNAMVGFADNDNYERTPATALPVTGNTDTGGVNGGGGVWAGYDWGSYSLELGITGRARHDQNMSFTDITTSGAYGTKQNVTTVDAIASLLYDIPLGYKLQPYIGGGAGVVWAHSETQLLDPAITDAPSSDDVNFAWQLQGGLKYPVGQNSLLRIDYRYIDMGRVSTAALPTGTADELSADLYSHDIRIGMSWGF